MCKFISMYMCFITPNIKVDPWQMSLTTIACTFHTAWSYFLEKSFLIHSFTLSSWCKIGQMKFLFFFYLLRIWYKKLKIKIIWGGIPPDPPRWKCTLYTCCALHAQLTRAINTHSSVSAGGVRNFFDPLMGGVRNFLGASWGGVGNFLCGLTEKLPTPPTP